MAQRAILLGAQLARENVKLGLIDLQEKSAAQTQELVAAEGAGSVVVAADVSDPTSCQKAVAEVAGALGSPSILVNNVGIVGARGNAVDVDPDEWDETMRVNVKSVTLRSKYTAGRDHGRRYRGWPVLRRPCRR